jgi:hypothetical protein
MALVQSFLKNILVKYCKADFQRLAAGTEARQMINERL